MTLTLLLDLDGTLLDNSVETFVPAYMAAVAEHIAANLDPGEFTRALLAATQRMIQNQDPNCLLEDVFNTNFYPRLGITRQDLDPLFKNFFEKVYPSLQPLTQRRPQAIEFVQQAFQRNFRVAIATNPLFPLTAIKQRLAWAGLPPREYPFAYVPGIENVHFAKPNPTYLAELLALMGWPEGGVLMVGDDIQNDIRSAQALGLAVFHVNGSVDQPTHNMPGSGRLSDLLDWIDATPADKFKPDYSSPTALLAVLRSTPAALNSLSQRIQPSKWNQRPREGEWSPAEIFCHLRDVDTEVNLPRLKKVVGETNPFIPGQDTDPWAEERAYIRQNGPLALNNFVTSRLQLLEILTRLDAKDWKSPARHAIFGPTDLQEMVSIIAGHDRLHIRQLFSMLPPIPS